MVDYEVQTPGRRQERRPYHVNLVKKWHPPDRGSRMVCLALDPNKAGDEMDRKMRVFLRWTGVEEHVYPIIDGPSVVELPWRDTWPV